MTLKKDLNGVQKNSMTLKVGTFNLFQYVAPPYSWYTKKDKFSIEEWKEKQSWVKTQLVEMDCDIVGFQEVFFQKMN